MDTVYYILVILLTIFIPLLSIILLVGIFNPKAINKRTKKDWSRLRIFGTGVITLIVGVFIFGSLINVTMPASVRADIEAQRIATEKAKVEAEQEKSRLQKQAEEDAAKKAQQQEEAPVVKLETVLVAVAFATIEQTDSSLPKGERKVVTAGVEGERTESYNVTYVKGMETAKSLKKSEITKEPVNQVVSVGTYVAPITQAKPKSSSGSSNSGSTAPAQNNSSSVYYANCTAVRAAGADPIYRGQPGYRSALDRDNDGIGCE